MCIHGEKTLIPNLHPNNLEIFIPSLRERNLINKKIGVSRYYQTDEHQYCNENVATLGATNFTSSIRGLYKLGNDSVAYTNKCNGSTPLSPMSWVINH